MLFIKHGAHLSPLNVKQNERRRTRKGPSMIHSASPTVTLVANIASNWNLFCLAKFRKYARTYGQHVSVTVGRPSGSRRNIFKQETKKTWKKERRLKVSEIHFRLSLPNIKALEKCWRVEWKLIVQTSTFIWSTRPTHDHYFHLLCLYFYVSVRTFQNITK